MEVIIKEIIIGKYEYDTAICDNIQIAIKKGQEKFVGKKVKIEKGICTEVAEPVKVQPAKEQYTKKSLK